MVMSVDVDQTFAPIKHFCDLWLLICLICCTFECSPAKYVQLIRVETVDAILDGKDGFVFVESNKELILTIVTSGIRHPIGIAFTRSKEDCSDQKGEQWQPAKLSDPGSKTNKTKIEYQKATVTLPMSDDEKKVDAKWYACVRKEKQSNWTHQGESPYRMLVSKIKKRSSSLPIEAIIPILIVLQFLSALFSGLNLGLMTLDDTELQILIKCGKTNEAKYAKRILPIRRHGNFLLCSLLLGNTLVNALFTTLFNDITSGTLAVVISTATIVIIGEIIPQTLCSRYGLPIAANTIVFTVAIMVLTAPVAWPLAKCIDLILGHDVKRGYDKDRLLELIKLSQKAHKLSKEASEIKIVTGALELSQKTVSNVMTPIFDCFMLSEKSNLNPKTIMEILNSGYTRIPVYAGERTKAEISGILNVKHLALIDPDDNVCVKTVCDFYQHRVRVVPADKPLMQLLEEFRTGQYHMAFVASANAEEHAAQSSLIPKVDSGGKTMSKTPNVSDDRPRSLLTGKTASSQPAGNVLNDPNVIGQIQISSSAIKLHVPSKTNCKVNINISTNVRAEGVGIIGLVTLEDIIEEIIQAEIVDETDIVVDNVKRTPRPVPQMKDFTLLTGDNCFGQRGYVSPQLQVAAYQFLSTSIDAFRVDKISDRLLQEMINVNVVKFRGGESGWGKKPSNQKLAGQQAKPEPDADKASDKHSRRYIYEAGVPVDYFVMILEGSVKVVMASTDKFQFNAGPFFTFGSSFMNQVANGSAVECFTPDYTAEMTDNVTLLYLRAKSYRKQVQRMVSISNSKNFLTQKISTSAEKTRAKKEPDTKQEQSKKGETNKEAKSSVRGISRFFKKKKDGVDKDK